MLMNQTEYNNRPQRLLSDGLVASAQRVPEKVALVIEGEPYTYQQLYNAAIKLAFSLTAKGLERGGRVAIYMDNSWHCAVSIYGVTLAGGVFVVINPQTKADKLDYVLDNCEAGILLTDYHLERVLTLPSKITSNLKLIIVSRGGANVKNDDIKLASFEEQINNAEVGPLQNNVIPNDLASLIYTTGSSGVPKGVMQTHQSMVFAIGSLIEYLRLSDSDRILLILPLAFDYGLYQLLMAVNLGATLIVERSFAFPAQIYDQIEKQLVTVLPGVPTVFTMMIASFKKQGRIFPSVTRVTNTAASLPEEYIPYLRKIFPNAEIYKMYGLTECKRVSYLEPSLIKEKPDSVGKAIPGTEVYIMTPEGHPAKAGEEGILYVRGPHIMAGYWKLPEQTKKMLKQGPLPGEHVLCTQDRFRMDEEGFLYYLGRTDDIIKTRGEKVSPVELENVLQQIPGVMGVAIVGVEDELLGNAIHAYIVKDPTAEISEKIIKRFCFDHLESFMVPRKIIFVDELPQNLNGKIDKRELLKIHEQ